MAWPAVSLEAAHALLTAPGAAFEMEERLVHGVKQRVWKNGPATMRDVFLAGRVHGAKTFLVYEDERATFEAFARATLAVAAALQAEGVTKGDRVVIAMRNLPEWPVALFATLLAGGIAVPLNAWWTGAELEYALLDSEAKVAIVDAERLERIAAVLPRCGALQRVLVSRANDQPANALLRRFEDITGAVNEWSALPDRPLPAVALDPGRRRDDLLHLRHHRRTQGRAGHAPQTR